jgi:hypothetical protein
LAKKVKSISFNDEVQEEKEILKFVSRRNFSRYVKTLIKQDMAAKMAAKSSEKLISSETPTPVKKNRYENYR